MNIILIAVSLLGLTNAHVSTHQTSDEEQMTQDWPPGFCNGNACPKYTVVNKMPGHEERRYASSKWVTTALTGVDYEMAGRTMFRKLFRYIAGNNVENRKISMTVPVLRRVIPAPGPSCKKNFTMSFYLDIDNPPQPNDENVYLSSLPQNLNVFVKDYGGFNSKETLLTKASELAEELSAESLTYDTGYYYFAGYNGPRWLTNRHNEIWFVKK